MKLPHSLRSAAWMLCGLLLASTSLRAEEAIPSIPRVLPPLGGVSLPDDLRNSLEKQIENFEERIWEINHKPQAADVAVLVKAVRYALELGEFYSEKEFPRANTLLTLAEERYQSINTGEDLPWLKQRGLVVRGYQSRVDDSYQPYGVEIPEALDLSAPVPLLVWLHGRGDKTTDLHFINNALSKSSAFGGFFKDQEEAIVLYPFGRQCVGWKHAGETDVFEAIEAVKANYPIDPDRIILAGFSMGGAGAWHLGAHFPDHFCAVHAGAGFAETKEYNRLTPEQYGPDYVQTLWQVYDVPDYLYNFLNVPLLAYSGENDRQKATADLMERAFATIGYKLHHVIGAEVEHKYTEAAVRESIRPWLSESWKRGRAFPASSIEWQTPTLRYPQYNWLKLTGLEHHWQNARVTATVSEQDRSISLNTSGVTALEIGPGLAPDLAGYSVKIGGQTLSARKQEFPIQSLSIVRRDGQWTWGEPDPRAKRPGLQGPIDDAFTSRFIVVPPDTAPSHPKFARWAAFELDHFRDRWLALMRGDLPERSSDGVEQDDLREANLILWGDPDSNSLIAKMAADLPVKWSKDSFTFRGKTYDRATQVPVLIFPNPLNPNRYVVINSGLTFREGHDRTNSQQNPKLPDWAVIGLDRDPDDLTPGTVIEAGFFDELWE